MIMNYTKQTELIDLNEVPNIPMRVIGCGALGSWVALILCKMGFKNIHLYDFDTIEEHNIPNQAFSEKFINATKMDGMENLLNYMNEDANDRIKFHNFKVDTEMANAMDGIILCCVDSMNTRKMLYKNTFLVGRAKLFIEGRIGIYGGYVYTLYSKSKEENEKYRATLYDDEEAEVSACGVSQTALPAAMNVATEMVMQMISWLKGNEPISEVRYQLPDFYTLNNKF